MAVAAPPRRASARFQIPRPQSDYRWVPWAVAGILGLWVLAGQLVGARTAVLEPDDNGVLFSTVTYLLHGQIPITDFYEPYGIGLGIPGVVPALLGFHGAVALRMAYGVMPALMTFLLTLFLWRRVRWDLALLVGVVSVCCSSPRYAMGFAPLFGFGVLVDRYARRTASGSLPEIAERHPRGLIGAAAVLSLAGWALVQNAVFPALWALILLIVLRGRRRWVQAGAAAFFAVLPTLIVIVTGGLTHLFWILRYLLTTGQAGFNAQRGEPIVWSFFTDRLSELSHFQFGQLDGPAWVFSTYAVGIAVTAAAVLMLLHPRGRQRVMRSDPTFILPLMLILSAYVLYVQLKAFSGIIGELGVPIWWAAGALLVRRLPAGLLALAVLVLAIPLVEQSSPGAIVDGWNTRAPIPLPRAARLDIPNEEGPDAAALQGLWRELGLDGRPTISINLHNDVTWGSDAVVPFLLNAPAAAWPLTYDPGLVNQADVERGTVASLCQNRAPVVQLGHDYPYPVGKKVYVGSRVLDEFLAVDYRVRAIAGEYRILIPSTPRCVLPWSLSATTLTRLRDAWIPQGQLVEAGAIAVALIDRERAAKEPVDPVNASAAALGGYALSADELPSGPLSPALQALYNGPAHSSMAAAAAARYPSDIEALAAQTAWVDNHAPGQPGQAAAVQAVVAMAVRHPNWPQAIANLTAIEPANGSLVHALAPGATGVAQFAQWELGFYSGRHDLQGEIKAGLAEITDYNRMDDPLDAAHAEFTLAGVRGLDPSCALLLRSDAASKPGVGLSASTGPAPTCSEPGFAQAVL